MLPHAPSSRSSAPLALIVLGAAAFGFGVWMQLRGIMPPQEFARLTGAETAFGIMARIGGPFCMLGLGLTAFTVLTSAAGHPDSPQPVPVAAEARDTALPAGIGPAHMAQWQRRLAEMAATPGPASADQVSVASSRGAATKGSFARNLNKAALVMVGVALAGTMAAAFLG